MSSSFTVMTIDPSGTTVHENPVLTSPVVGTVVIGDLMEVLGEPEEVSTKLSQEGEWFNVCLANEKTGYVPAWKVRVAWGAAAGEIPEPPRSAAPPLPDPIESDPVDEAVASDVIEVPAIEGETVYVRTTEPDGLYVRTGPNRSYKDMALILPIHKCKMMGNTAKYSALIGKQNEWLPIALPDGRTGWTASWYLEKWPAYHQPKNGHALRGIHGPADPGKWPWNNDVYKLIKKTQMQAVKVLCWGDIDAEIVNDLRGLGVKMILARLFGKFESRRTVDSFINEVKPAMHRLYNAGVRRFEVHNEPNLHHRNGPEGMWVMWDNGAEFGEFLLDVISKLRPDFPGAMFGWPGLSPGFDEVNTATGAKLRYDSGNFLEEGKFAADQCDFICLHTYWQHDGYTRSLREINDYCEMFPDKEIHVSEFSNSAHDIGKDIKGRQYAQFYSEAKKQCKPNLAALYSYVMSASWGYTPETWLGTVIPDEVERTLI